MNEEKPNNNNKYNNKIIQQQHIPNIINIIDSIIKEFHSFASLYD